MVTDRYLSIFHHPDVDDFIKSLEGYEIIAVDNLAGSVPLASTALPRNAVLVFGSEREGLSDELVASARTMVAIEQQGSTRSINASAAAAIVMYEWQRQNIL